MTDVFDFLEFGQHAAAVVVRPGGCAGVVHHRGALAKAIRSLIVLVERRNKLAVFVHTCDLEPVNSNVWQYRATTRII